MYFLANYDKIINISNNCITEEIIEKTYKYLSEKINTKLILFKKVIIIIILYNNTYNSKCLNIFYEITKSILSHQKHVKQIGTY